ncbi:helicase C-terminal domain-containing protein [Aeromonas veronii]|uniref:helicase C-terminal domain-containing protein n=1 Tax=Aeromonas sp. R7-5 TaxID=3138477 RepID=UPI0034A178A9
MSPLPEDGIHTAKFEELMAAGGLIARDEQTQYALLAEQVLADTGKISLLHADTGLGKSLGYLLPAMQFVLRDPRRPRVIVATHSHALMQQLLEKDCVLLTKVARHYGHSPLSIGRLLGRVNFVSPKRVNIALANRSLSTLEEREVATLRDWSGTIAEFEDEFGGLPCDLLASQICLTAECENGAFDEQQQAESQCDIVITTHAMIAVDMLRNNALLADKSRPTVLIVDEADALVDRLQEWTQRRLNLVRVASLLGEHLTARQLAPLTNSVKTIQERLGMQQYAWDTELAELARVTIGKIEKICRLNNLDKDVSTSLQQQLQMMQTSSMGIGVSQIRCEPAIVSLSPWFVRFFGKYATSAFESVLLTSGTLSITPEPVNGTTSLRIELGIEDTMLGAIALFSPKIFGNMALTLAGPSFPSIYSGAHQYGTRPSLSEKWLQAVVRQITNRSGRVVVLTASHEESQKLAAIMSPIENRQVLVHQRGIPLKSLTEEFKKICKLHGRGVMITAAGHTGLNIIDNSGSIGFDHLIITRIAYGQPHTSEVEALVSFYKKTKKIDLSQQLRKQEYMRTQNAVVRLMRQAIGRGIRSPDDSIEIDILDPRFPLSHDLSSKHAILRNIIPVRFLQQYRQAKVLLTDGEQSPATPMEVYF